MVRCRVASSPPKPPPRFTPLASSAAAPPPGGTSNDPPPPRKGRKPIFWIALGCTGCVVLPVVFAALFAGVIGGGVFFMTREPVKAVESQLQEIRDGKLDAAYARLSAAHRARLSREDFAQLVAKHPALQDNASVSFFNRSLNNDQMHLGGTLLARSGAKERVDIELFRENGEWKVSAIRFPDE